MRICVLGGDGIGPRVTEEAVRVLEAATAGCGHTDSSIELIEGAVGYGAYLEHGTPLPSSTLELARSSDSVLLGAVTTPPAVPNYSSPVLGLRKELDLFACVRPIRSLAGAVRPVNMVIVRENTEGLYVGHERATPDTAVSERVITRAASERIVRFAFEEALRGGYGRVTVVHKANVLRETCGLFRRTALEVAREFPEVRVDEMLVDRCAMELIRAPDQFGIIVTTNLFGDILSDEAAMLAGGLGVASSANIGARHAMFEPVHGSAPDLPEGSANPLAAIRAASAMLHHLKRGEAAARIDTAIETVLKSSTRTADLGGSASTSEVTDAVIAALG